MKELPALLRREHNLHFVNDVLDFIEDVEEERASVRKKNNESQSGENAGKSDPPKAEDKKQKQAVGDLVKCEVEDEKCLKEKTAAIVAATPPVHTGGSAKGVDANGARPAAPDLSAISAFDEAELSYAKLMDAINELEKHPLDACPETCGRCLDAGGVCQNSRVNGRKKSATQPPPCSKRCQALIAQGFDVRENELKVAVAKHQEDYKKAFGFSAKSGIAANEKSLAEARKKLASAKDPKEKAELIKRKEQLELALVTARSRYHEFRASFDKSVAEIATHLRKISELPKD